MKSISKDDLRTWLAWKSFGEINLIMRNIGRPIFNDDLICIADIIADYVTYTCRPDWSADARHDFAQTRNTHSTYPSYAEYI